MRKYFKIINLETPCSFILWDGARFDLRTGIPNNSLEVWKTGRFNYLGLLPEAAELFTKEKISEVIRLINQSKNIEDIKILASAKPDAVKVQEASESRINFLIK